MEFQSPRLPHHYKHRDNQNYRDQDYFVYEAQHIRLFHRWTKRIRCKKWDFFWSKYIFNLMCWQRDDQKMCGKKGTKNML